MDGRTSPALGLLLALRFLLELALLAAIGVGTARALDGWAGVLVGIVAAVAVAVLWGALLSPRRPVRLPLAVRIVVELALFVGAGALLASTGLVGWGAALVVAELVVLGLLKGPDTHAPTI